MQRTHHLRSMVPIIGAVLFLGGCTHTENRSEAGICTFSTEQTSQGQYAIGKCAKASSPGNFVIRSVVKRADDETEYARRARLAGQRLTCDLIRTGRSYNRTDYRVTNCRR